MDDNEVVIIKCCVSDNRDIIDFYRRHPVSGHHIAEDGTVTVGIRHSIKERSRCVECRTCKERLEIYSLEEGLKLSLYMN